MSEQLDATRQMAEEQSAVDEMFEIVDAEVTEKRFAMKRVLADSSSDTSDRFLRDVEAARLTESIAKLTAAESSLCFGRIDFSDGGTPLHIGRLGLRRDSGDPALIDWRAAAAAPFYSATLATPMGVRRRRHIRLKRRLVLDLTDEILDGTAPLDEDLVGDGPLVAALSSARTGRMQEAAGTLQSEQDRIVRSSHRGITVVDGGPGTGKTVVALHRAAYVLYAFPEIADRGVLVFGPNRRFLSYISGVLPSLGENDVHLATMSDLLSVDATRTEPDRLARLKGDAALADALARRVQQHQPHGVPLTLRAGADTVVLDAVQVDTARRQALDGGAGHNQSRDLFVEYIVDAVIRELEIRTAKEESEFEEELQSLLGIDLDRFTGTAGQVNADVADRDRGIDWDLVRDDLLEDPVIDRTISQVWPRLDAGEVLRGLLGDSTALARAVPPGDHADIPKLFSSASDPWSQADLALLDEARALIDGPPEQTFGHIVVDEAQQLSPMQWRTLMRRCPGRSMTIVGDLAQSGPTTPPAQAWSDVLAPFVEERFSHHRLSVNYRTTAEILQSTEHLLAKIAPDQRLSRSLRHGESPQTVVTAPHHVRQTLGTLTAEVERKHPGELIGIICPTDHMPMLAEYATELNVSIIPAPEARGLEFDTVIILDPDRIQKAGDAGLRDLYVAQTRATKRLISVRIDGPSL